MKAKGDRPGCAEEIDKALQLQIDREMVRELDSVDGGYEADDERVEDEL